ncbi:UNKNOWN [Stylonychia lemnae]|uniref:Uncharacterized protein n=1 Tax=Stylonychia lemnae TaxID=5949 RepID=A0A078B156_STYLE|nr:UNKNOWN [Stylonychia lemnae]|eukprot:CDW88061.1 UNKNOWN [Stylonychia lemnae]
MLIHFHASYLCGIDAISFSMLIIRILTLSFKRTQVNLENFPSNCGDWSIPNGCTRIVKNHTGCVRPKTIPGSYPFYFKESYEEDDGSLIKTIEYADLCSQMVGFNRRVYPDDDIDYNSRYVYLHHYVETPFFGIINDFYVMYGYEFNRVYVAAQSQSRFSGDDSLVNYNNVQSFYKCMTDMTNENPYNYRKPCS